MMSSKQFEIISKGNTKSRLTVTPTRVTIKLAPDHQFAPEITRFLTRVAETQIMSNVEQSFRGVLQVNRSGFSIIMKNDSESMQHTFNGGDL